MALVPAENNLSGISTGGGDTVGYRERGSTSKTEKPHVATTDYC